jgi:PAS domain S-box-containing protein
MASAPGGRRSCRAVRSRVFRSVTSHSDRLAGLTIATGGILALLVARDPGSWAQDATGVTPIVRAVASALLAATAIAGLRSTAPTRGGVHRPLLLGLAVTATCAAVARLSLALGLPMGPAAILQGAVYPSLIVGSAAALGWRRRARRRDLALDVSLLICAAAVVGITLVYAAPEAPGGPSGAWDIGQRSMPIALVALVALLLASGRLGRDGAVGFGVGTVTLALSTELTTWGPFLLSRAVLQIIALCALALAVRGFARAAAPEGQGREVTGSSVVRARFIMIATGVVSIATFVLGFRGESSPSLAVAVAVFVALLAARASRSMATQGEQALLLARSVEAERALSATLEQRIAERSGELANAERILQRMWMLGQHVALELHPARVLERFMETVLDIAHADGGAIGLVADDMKVRISVASGSLEGAAGTMVPREGSAFGRVIQTGRTLTVDDATLHPGLLHVSSERYRQEFRSLAIVPLQRRGERIGVVAICADTVAAFSADDVARVEAMSDMLSVALANAELVEGLRQAELRFRTLFRAAPDAVLTLQLGGRVREANDYVRELVGLDPAAVVGRDLLDFVAAKDQRRLREALSAAFAGLPARLEVDVLRQRDDGEPPETRVVALAARRLPETDPPTLLIIGRDTTGEREMRARLMETERLAAVGELVAGVAHEVNNPLSSISAFAQLMLRDETLTAAQRESVEVIRSETGRASQVVRDLLAFARRSSPHREALDLNQVVERTVRLRNYQLTASGVKVAVDLSTEIPAILGDARQLQQVVLNLVTNAIQAMAGTGGGTLALTTRADGPRVILEVADTGPGIPANLRARVFEPFFTTKPEGEGTGLGLSVSYGIVTAHGGTITLVDAADGSSGARFLVTLPAADARAERFVSAEVPKFIAQSPLAGLTVLFVDDEASLRHGFEAFGKLRGFGVVSAADGRVALDTLRTANVDAVVTDLRMPGVDGVALYQSLLSDYPALAARTLFITGDLISMEARLSDDRPMLTKPFSFERLEEMLVGILSIGEPRDSVG